MKYPEDFINKIICGDCLEVMKEIPDNSVDLVVTSPPYDNLRDYKGYSFNFECTAKELLRVIKDGGVVVWVVGDATINGSETGTSFKQALYFKEIGFNLHDTMIYFKENYLPAQKDNKRYANSFEYMFILSKNRPNILNQIMEDTKWGDSSKVGTFRGKNGKTTQRDMKSGTERIISNIWTYNVGYMKSTKDIIAFEHPGIFPEKLAGDHIMSWSDKNDLVLDPMCGSGTTCKMAKQLNRKFIGIEISEKYCEIARQRLRQGVLNLTIPK